MPQQRGGTFEPDMPLAWGRYHAPTPHCWAADLELQVRHVRVIYHVTGAITFVNEIPKVRCRRCVGEGRGNVPPSARPPGWAPLQPAMPPTRAHAPCLPPAAR